MLRLLALIFVVSLFAQSSFAQDSSLLRQKKLHWLEPSPTLNKGRLIGVSTITLGLYGGAMIGLNEIWYRGYPRSKFHWFADEAEWQQIDKTGHFHAPYFISNWTYGMLRWSGMKNTPAALLGGSFGFLSMAAIEIPDGLSQKWGASWSDLAFDFGGAALSTIQNLIWKEQRIMTKYSFELVNYPRGELRDRANELYGKGFGERIIKDYNGISLWCSVNLHAFNHNIKPEWLCISVGYAAGGMYGGFDNTWTDKNGVYHNRNDVKRYRRFFISADADFTRIKTKSRFGKTLLTILNIVKLPSPAIEFNTKGQVIFHPMYFLNLEYPIVWKK